MGIFDKITLTSLRCVCTGVCPSHTTNKRPTDSDGGHVCRAFYFALHLPLTVSKAVLSSWSLVVIGALISQGTFKPELEFQPGTSSYFQAGTSSNHAIYVYENIVYVEVPDNHLCHTYVNIYVAFSLLHLLRCL